MRARIHLGMLIIFVLISASLSFGTPNAITTFSLPEKSAFLMNQKSWDGFYNQVIENLPNDKFVPGRILFKINGSPEIRTWTFNPKTNMANMLAYVKSLPNVEYCQPDYIYTVDYKATIMDEDPGQTEIQQNDEPNLNQPNDPYYKRQGFLGIIGMNKLFERYGPNLEKLIAKGHDPYIHIVDSGGGCDHPDLNHVNIITRRDFVDGDNNPCSSPNGMSPHGEFIATILGAIPNNNHGGAGILPPNAKLLIWRVFDSNGYGYSSTIDVALAEIVAESNGLGNEIVNMSFSGPGIDPLEELIIAEGSATREKGGKNITFVAASGNGGNRILQYPAAFSGVMSVGASEFPSAKTGEVQRVAYTSYGKIDIMAPVDNGILVEGRVYDLEGNPTKYAPYLISGTSFAAPMISGIAALAVNMGIYGPATIYKLLIEVANDMIPSEYEQKNGWSMVRADKAIMSVDDFILASGLFSQNGYGCTVLQNQNPEEDTCETTIYYSFKSQRPSVYIYDDFGKGTLRNLGSFDSKNSVAIKVGLEGKTNVKLIYYPDNGNIPIEIASTSVTARPKLKPVASFSQDKYACKKDPIQNTCQIIVSYQMRTNGWNVYLYQLDFYPQENRQVDFLTPLGNSATSGNITVTTALNRIMTVELIYYPDNTAPSIFAQASIY